MEERMSDWREQSLKHIHRQLRQSKENEAHYLSSQMILLPWCAAIQNVVVPSLSGGLCMDNLDSFTKECLKKASKN